MSQKLSLTYEPGIADRRLEQCDLMHTNMDLKISIDSAQLVCW